VAVAVGHVELAHVVHQGAHTQRQQLVFRQAQAASDQQGHDGRVQRMRGGTVATAADQPDTDVLADQHLVQNGARQRFGGAASFAGLRADGVAGLAPCLGGLSVLALAALGCLTLGAELLPALKLGTRLCAGMCRLFSDQGSSCLGGGLLIGCGRDLALLGLPAHARQAQPAQRGDLLG